MVRKKCLVLFYEKKSCFLNNKKCVPFLFAARFLFCYPGYIRQKFVLHEFTHVEQIITDPPLNDLDISGKICLAYVTGS